MFHRPRPKPDPEVSALERMLEAEIKEVGKNGQAMAGVAEAWAASMPEGMDPHFERITPSRVLIVRIPSAATRFLAARALKQGGEKAIIEASKGRVRSIKLEVADAQRSGR